MWTSLCSWEGHYLADHRVEAGRLLEGCCGPLGEQRWRLNQVEAEKVARRIVNILNTELKGFAHISSLAYEGKGEVRDVGKGFVLS